METRYCAVGSHEQPLVRTICTGGLPDDTGTDDTGDGRECVCDAVSDRDQSRLPSKTICPLRRQVWRLLNAIGPQVLRGEGRVYGGGLSKLEPKELGRVPVAAVVEFPPESARSCTQKQGDLFEAALVEVERN